ncbi:MAG: hypothetical protein ABIJ97_18260 [Bacteroidota bacterium]
METLTVKKTNGKATKIDVASLKSKAEISSVKFNQPEKVKPNGQEKPEVTKVEISAPPKPVMTLEQKIEKIENLKTLIEKREKLEASRKKLTSFVFGTNQFNENIVLTDESGNTFKTSNSEVFTKVVKTINETLVEKISEIENQINF